MLSSVARASRPCSPGPTGQRPVPLPNQAEASFEVSDPQGMKPLYLSAYGTVSPNRFAKMIFPPPLGNTPMISAVTRLPISARALFTTTIEPSCK